MPFAPVHHDVKEALPFFHSTEKVEGLWLPILSNECSFSTSIFEDVMYNLIKNPNINSSYLFRADILYDSDTQYSDVDYREFRNGNQGDGEWDGEIKRISIVDFIVTRTVVRKLIPRNPQLDKLLIQTCIFLKGGNEQEEESSLSSSRGISRNGSNTDHTLVIYIPHAREPSNIPFYHPPVRGIAYLHCGTAVSFSYLLFPNTNLTPRLLRTASSLLSVAHKHGQGTAAGYEKRVQHDALVPQKAVQDTYTALKARHANRLITNWVESTDPAKHVFEDLAITAFLIELWKDMYPADNSEKAGRQVQGPSSFVDIGCGNGVLVDILLHEGFEGWGFDARRRKMWRTFEQTTQVHLHELVLVPAPLLSSDTTSPAFAYMPEPTSSIGSRLYARHNGIFTEGSFVISNHADQLTTWTPLLALLSFSPFLCIPCCSHALSGARFRAPVRQDIPPPEESQKTAGKQPSAYAALCGYVAYLAREAGYNVDREMLRIPSTRNVGIRGRLPKTVTKTREERAGVILKLLEQEGGCDGWIERVELLRGRKEKNTDSHSSVTSIGDSKMASLKSIEE
ncbi:MAG: tRNA(Ser) Um(44) 2'-O-methyltransferase [Vezdaea acicularis]|nr:MAG: tRNA(Ser) Um(44) 2'-O-methyltransferase [Vezdaea acicularis]